jgi:hypothetical protein
MSVTSSRDTTMDRAQAYVRHLTKSRKQERRTEKLMRRFERQMKIAMKKEREDLVIMADKCIKTLQNAMKMIAEEKKREREKMKTCACPICLDEMKAIVVVLQCGHIFHKECQSEWARLNSACAVCRTTTHLPPNELCEDCSPAALNMPHSMIMEAVNEVYPDSFSCNKMFT